MSNRESKLSIVRVVKIEHCSGHNDLASGQRPHVDVLIFQNDQLPVEPVEMPRLRRPSFLPQLPAAETTMARPGVHEVALDGVDEPGCDAIDADGVRVVLAEGDAGVLVLELRDAGLAVLELLPGSAEHEVRPVGVGDRLEGVARPVARGDGRCAARGEESRR